MSYISYHSLLNLLDELKKEYEVYVPAKKGENLSYKKYLTPGDALVVGEVRPLEPLKSFFTPARQKVADGFKPEVPGSGNKPFAILGVKSCDLKGFKVQDYVFKNHDCEDPFYARLRRENLIISSDCTRALDTCFCLAVDVKPYPQEDFDINLSPVKGGFVVKAGSKKGQELYKKHASLFEEAGESSLADKEEQRDRVVKEVKKNLSDNGVPRQNLLEGAVKKNYESELWKEEAKTCVECGACNTICPTCHCFFLYDQKDKKRLARFKTWDSCMFKDFARVAGGANPRERLWMRLRNRFEKKFDFFPRVADIYACTGCGRCISACPAKIDIRKVLKRLVENAGN